MKTVKIHFKIIVLLLFGILLFPIAINAQTKSIKIKTYNVRITMLDHSKENGILYSADEEFIKISKNNSLDVSNLTTINAQNIDIIKIRRKGKVGNSALIGGLSGIGFSVMIGASAGDESFFTREETAALAGILFVPLGTGIGALTGSKSEFIAINGNLKNYLNSLKLIQSYSLNLNVKE